MFTNVCLDFCLDHLFSVSWWWDTSVLSVSPRVHHHFGCEWRSHSILNEFIQRVIKLKRAAGIRRAPPGVSEQMLAGHFLSFLPCLSLLPPGPRGWLFIGCHGYASCFLNSGVSGQARMITEWKVLAEELEGSSSESWESRGSCSTFHLWIVLRRRLCCKWSHLFSHSVVPMQTANGDDFLWIIVTNFVHNILK